MKKKALLSLLLFALGTGTVQLNAQNSSQFGIRGGINGANIINSDFNTEIHTQFLAGFYARFPVASSRFALQSEILYTRKGFEAQSNTFRFDYIEVPVLARFDFVSNSPLLPHVYLGPYIGIKVNADTPPLAVAIFGQPNTPLERSFNEGDINTIDFGINVGGGLNFGRLDLGVRYSAGLKAVSDDENVDAKNGVFAIVTGIEL